MTNQPILPNQQPQIQKPKKRSKKVIIILIVILVVVLGFAGLTKAGFIPNYLGLEILCSQKEDLPTFNRSEDYISSCLEKCKGLEENLNPLGYLSEKENCEIDCKIGLPEKPVIYLYPTQPQEIKVILDYFGEDFISYPEYNRGWDVIAYPDGKIFNLADNKEYSYLFWEGKNNSIVDYNLSFGFVVEGKNTVDFLQTKLKEFGLMTKEYNEFIVYWYPQMMNNKYNLIHFATKEEYNDRAVLEITPKPDSVLRVFMVFKKLDEKTQVNPQEIKSFERKGFTVVEWGGTEIK